MPFRFISSPNPGVIGRKISLSKLKTKRRAGGAGKRHDERRPLQLYLLPLNQLPLVAQLPRCARLHQPEAVREAQEEISARPDEMGFGQWRVHRDRTLRRVEDAGARLRRPRPVPARRSR